MGFRPEVGEEIILNQDVYTFTKHPAVLGLDIPYGQEGRQGIVYQLRNEKNGGKIALKVFKERYREEQHQLQFLQPLSNILGFKVSSRYIVTEEEQPSAVGKSEELINSIVMQWIEGPTWADILQEQKALSKQQCFVIAEALITTLKTMEEQQIAHNDLSSSNILIPYLSENYIAGQHTIELVDIEQMYSPKNKRPSLLPAGSAGYAPIFLKSGVWQREADRFAGAILLAEILGWCDPAVRSKKWTDASYFKAEEIQTTCERYRILQNSLQSSWTEEIATLFERAWNSKAFTECPSFLEWYEALEGVRNILKVDEAKQEAISNSLFLSKCLEIARLLEEKEYKQAALHEYRTILDSPYTSNAVKQELTFIISTLEAGQFSRKEPAVLQCYLELAAELERANKISLVCFIYKRIIQFPNVNQSLKNELESIIQELEENEQEEHSRQEVAAAAATPVVPSNILHSQKKKTKQVEYDIDDEILNAKASNQPLTFATQEKKEPSAFAKWWKKEKKRVIIIGSVILVLGVGAFSYYFYKTNTEYQKFMTEGRKAYDAHKYQIAEENVLKAIQVKGKAEAHLQLASIYIAEGKNKIAIDYLTKLIKSRDIDDTNSEAMYLLASANFRIENFREAVSNYEKALNNSKGLGSYKKAAMRDLAISYMKMKELEKAEDIIVKMEAKTKQDQALVAYLKGQLATATVQLDKAEMFFKQAVQLDSQNTIYVKELSNLYIFWNKTNLIDSTKKEKNYQTAAQYLQETIAHDKQNIEMLNQLGTVYYEFGQFYETRDAGKSTEAYKQALNAYSQLLNLGVRDTNALVNLGVLYDKVGQAAEAERFFAEALRKNDEDPHVNFVYGMFKIKQKQYAEANNFLQKTVRANANQAEAQTAQQKLAELKTNGWIQ